MAIAKMCKFHILRRFGELFIDCCGWDGEEF